MYKDHFSKSTNLIKVINFNQYNPVSCLGNYFISSSWSRKGIMAHSYIYEKRTSLYLKQKRNPRIRWSSFHCLRALIHARNFHRNYCRISERIIKFIIFHRRLIVLRLTDRVERLSSDIRHSVQLNNFNYFRRYKEFPFLRTNILPVHLSIALHRMAPSTNIISEIGELEYFKQSRAY